MQVVSPTCGVVVKVKGGNVCKALSTANGAQFPPAFAPPPYLSGCCTECFSLIQSRIAPSLAYVLWLGCQSMTDSYSGRSQQDGNWPCSPQDICSGSARSQGLPMWGFSFTLRHSEHYLWAGKSVSHFRWAYWGCFAFYKENWEFPIDWKFLFTLTLVPQIDSPIPANSHIWMSHQSAEGHLSLCWTVQI